MLYLDFLKESLKPSLDAKYPILYLQTHDEHVVDTLISELFKSDFKIHEWNHANGWCRFEGKLPLNQNKEGLPIPEQDLAEFDDLDQLNQSVIVLKDIHHFLKAPPVIARLRSLTMKILQNNLNAKLIIISDTINIPIELEKYISLIELPYPQATHIQEIVDIIFSHQCVKLQTDEINSLASNLKGLSFYDVNRVLNMIVHMGNLKKEANQLIAIEKEQVIKKSGILEMITLTEKLEHIGGLNELKKWLNRKADVIHHLDEAVQFGVDLPKGVMIMGMPGCGKSLSAKATAYLFELPLLRLDIGKLLGKYVGDSEANMRRALKLAEAVSPCVLWVDELEKAFAGIGGGGGADVTTRLFGFFLTWLQEKKHSVFVVATANNIDYLPPELLRKGRFDELFYVNFPNESERKSILEIHLEKRKQSSTASTITDSKSAPLKPSVILAI